jgi:hypothetical protein
MQTNLSATSPLSVALGSALPPAVVGAPLDTPRFGPTLGQCLTDLKKAADEYKGHVEGAFVADIRVGNAALTAQDLLPYGEFGKWIEDNITAITPQWVRACMRAAEVLGYLEGHPQRDTVLSTHRGLQNLAGLLVPLEELKAKAKPGETLKLDTLIATPPKLKPKAAKLKIDRSPDAGKDEEDGADTATGAKLQAAIDADDLRRREAALKLREAALTAREKELDERERNLAMREARVNTDAPTDAKPRKPSKEPESIDAIKARLKAKEAEKEARAALERAKAAPPAEKPARKASRKPAVAAGSVDQAEGGGVPALDEKTAPTQPVTGATPVPGDEEVM